MLLELLKRVQVWERKMSEHRVCSIWLMITVRVSREKKKSAHVKKDLCNGGSRNVIVEEGQPALAF